MQNLLDESWSYYEKLKKIMNSGLKNTQTLGKLMNELKTTYENFGRQLQLIGENFHIEITKENADENDALIVCYQSLSNYILKMGHSHLTFAKNICSEILEPFNTVTLNFKSTNKEISNEIYELLKSLDGSRNNMKKHQDTYYKLSKTTEKSEEIVEKIMLRVEKGECGMEDLQKANTTTVKLKKETQETLNNYKICLGTVNKMWDSYHKNFPSILEKFDFNNESRISFCKNSINRYIKIMTNLYLVENNNSSQFFEEKLKEQEDKLFSGSKPGVLKQMLKGKYLASIKQEELISYENWKKNKEGHGFYKTENIEGDFVVISDPISPEERKIIYISFAKLIDEKVPIKKSQMFVRKLSESTVDDEIKRSESSGYSSESEEETNEIFNNLKEAMKNQFCRKLFIDYFTNHLKKKNYIYLFEERFNIVLSFFFDILNNLSAEKEFDIEMFYNILIVSSRIGKKNESKHFSEYLSTKLNGLKLWEDKKCWEHLFIFLLNRQLNEKKNKISQEAAHHTTSIPYIPKVLMKGIFKVGKTIGMIEQTKAAPEILTNEKGVLEEINFYLINLGIKNELALDFIIDLAKKYNIEEELVKKLLEKQDNKRSADLRKCYIDNYDDKSKRKNFSLNFDEKWGKTYPIAKAIDYLSYKDNLTKLSLVCKDWNKKLQTKILKAYLIKEQNNKAIKAKRIQIWLSKLTYKNIQCNYEDIKNRVIKGELPANEAEIISLDVQRSLFLHQDTISSNTLQTLLASFALEDRETSYCQGMNYIMGFLYINLRDEEKTFKCFCYLMKIYFENMFTKDLYKLRLLFYQFERCLMLILPELAEYFKIERVECNYYATPWFVTIFTSVFQYTESSYTLSNIWDIFLCEGWKGLFKCCIYILKIYEKKLLQCPFDDILNFLTDLVKTELFLTKDSEESFLKMGSEIEFIKNLKKEITKIKITNSLLKTLEKDYENRMIRIQKKLDETYKKK